jgi:hypothetical protein
MEYQRIWLINRKGVSTKRVYQRIGRINGTRAARSGLVVSTGDHRMVGYRIPTEWGTLTEEQRVIVSVAGSKRSDFLG